MTEVVFVVPADPEAGYIARALGASSVTDADDMPRLRIAVRDAVRCHFDDAPAPMAIRLHFAHDGRTEQG